MMINNPFVASVVAAEKVYFYLKLLEIVNKMCYRICKISNNLPQNLANFKA